MGDFVFPVMMIGDLTISGGSDNGARSTDRKGN